MTRISLYLQDFEDEQVEKLEEKYDVSFGYILSMLLEAIDDGRIDLDEII